MHACGVILLDVATLLPSQKYLQLSVLSQSHYRFNKLNRPSLAAGSLQQTEN